MNDLSVRKFYGWFTALGLLVGVLVVIGYYRDEYREWKNYQHKFIQEKSAGPRRRNSGRWLNKRRCKSGRSSCPTSTVWTAAPRAISRWKTRATAAIRNRSPIIRCTSNIRSSDLAAPSAIAAGPCHDRCRCARLRAALDQPMLPLQYIQASCGQCTRPPTIPPRPNWRAASRCSRTAAAAAATNSAARVASSAGTRQGRRPPFAGMAEKTFPRARIGHARLRDAAAKFSETNLEAIILFMLSQTGESAPGYYASMKVIPSASEGQRLFQQKAALVATPSATRAARSARRWTTSACGARPSG